MNGKIPAPSLALFFQYLLNEANILLLSDTLSMYGLLFIIWYACKGTNDTLTYDKDEYFGYPNSSLINIILSFSCGIFPFQTFFSRLDAQFKSI